MNNEKDIEMLDALALEIIEAGEDITDEQLRQLKSDALLRERCQELLDMRTACRTDGSSLNVDKALWKFGGRHTHTSHSKKRIMIVTTLTAIAAMLIGGVLILNNFLIHNSDKQTATIEKTPQSVSITDEQGERIVTGNTPAQFSSISIDDYRSALGGDADIESLVMNVPPGKSADISLPDGSVACLHPGSRLTFPSSFVGGKRVVKLEGEAYFKVCKDALHPFIVMTDELETTVLGTEFNVKRGEVTLISGSVKVTNAKTRRSVTISPGEQLRLHDDGMELGMVDTLPYIYWRDGYLFYDNMELKDIMESIGQNYGMTVEFRHPRDMNIKMRFFTGRNSGIDSAIKLMNRMKKVNVYKRGDKIIVE